MATKQTKNEKNDVRRVIHSVVPEMRKKGTTWREIAERLTHEGYTTVSGKPISSGYVSDIINTWDPKTEKYITPAPKKADAKKAPAKKEAPKKAAKKVIRRPAKTAEISLVEVEEKSFFDIDSLKDASLQALSKGDIKAAEYAINKFHEICKKLAS